MRSASLAILLLSFSACHSVTPRSAADRIHGAEQRLIDTETVQIDYVVESRGAVSADFHGVLRFDGDMVSLTWAGEFAGSKKTGAFERIDADPPALREALIVGLSRMGILHNLVRLCNGAEPDHAGGGVRDWVRADQPRQHAGTVSFGLVVDGRPSGHATLWFDQQELPARRQQTVAFDGNRTMRVAESYRVQRIDD